MPFTQPWDLRTIFINILSGNTEIFTFISFILIAVAAASFRMRDRTFLIMIALFSVLLSQYVGGIYLIVLLLSGIGIFFAITRLIK